MPEGWRSKPQGTLERFGVSQPPKVPYEVVTTSPKARITLYYLPIPRYEGQEETKEDATKAEGELLAAAKDADAGSSKSSTLDRSKLKIDLATGKYTR